MNDDAIYDDVLQFWFGGDQQLNYKRKWFPTNEKKDAQSKSQQELIDTEICLKYKSLLSMALGGGLKAWKYHNFRSCLALIMSVNNIIFFQ